MRQIRQIHQIDPGSFCHKTAKKKTENSHLKNVKKNQDKKKEKAGEKERKRR
jgi:hypothetical protein